MNEVHHPIDHTELGAPNLAATRGYYRAAFGWRFVDDGPDYAGILAPDGEKEVGGLNRGGPTGGGGALVLRYSQDLDATAEAVRVAGGEVIQGPYEFAGGRRFHFTDPSGHELGVWAQA